MANTAQARKRGRQAEKNRQQNASMRSMLRTYIKSVIKAIEIRDKNKAQEAFKIALPIIDRMANKGLIHKHKAARHKSRLSAHIKTLAG